MTLDELRPTVEHLLKLPDGPRKVGLIETAKEVLFSHFVEEDITKETYLALLALLAPDSSK